MHVSVRSEGRGTLLIVQLLQLSSSTYERLSRGWNDCQSSRLTIVCFFCVVFFRANTLAILPTLSLTHSDSFSPSHTLSLTTPPLPLLIHSLSTSCCKHSHSRHAYLLWASLRPQRHSLTCCLFVAGWTTTTEWRPFSNDWKAENILRAVPELSLIHI